MIEKMQKVTVVCLAQDRQTTVAKLQELGSLHVVPCRAPASGESDDLNRELEQLNELLNVLQGLKLPLQARQKQEFSLPQARKVAAQGASLLLERKATAEKLQKLQQAIQQLEPWGQFSPAQLQQLETAGWHVALCQASGKQLPTIPEGCQALTVNSDGKQVRYLLLSRNSLEGEQLPIVSFPLGMDLGELRQQAQRLQLQQCQQEQTLAALAQAERQDLERLAVLLTEQLEFLQARDGMGETASLAFITGFVPASQLDNLRAAVRQQGWGIRYEEADQEDPEVPTKLCLPRQFQIAHLIFDVIGVLPGYNEVDVSIPLVIFLTIFCGFLVGDAGYGLLFLLLAGWLWKKSQAGTTGRLGVILLAVFSAAILLFGALSGNWFGIPPASLPLPFRGIPWLSDDANGSHVKLLCFFIGATHLSLARIWSALRSSKLKEALGHLGWGLFLWGNFFTVKMLIIGGDFGFLPKLLYVIAAPLILLFAIDWTNFGAVIYTPFDFINSVVDVLSYIRLYAVGLSSLYIAQNFNEMSQMIWGVSPWLIPVGLLVILAGHVLNIALAGMGVLVHGIRLNTLEFSNHVGLTWSGHPYKPLSRH